VPSRNCYANFGADDLEMTARSSAPGVADDDSCKEACLELSECNGVVVTKTPAWIYGCYRKRIHDPQVASLAGCEESDAFDVLQLLPSPPPPSPPTLPSPPSPPPVPPSDPTAASVVARLNRRFSLGSANMDPSQPGVIVHQFEAFTSDIAALWTPCSPNAWCRSLGDRISASLINSKLRGLYNPSEGGGFVVSVSKNEVLCSWARDAGSVRMVCEPPGVSDTCVPGCIGEGMLSEGAWCSPSGSGEPCPWRPEQLSLMAMQLEEATARGVDVSYNEVIIEAQAWGANMPNSIEAVYYLAGADDEATATNSNHAFRAQQALLDAYGVAPPLIKLDLLKEDTLGFWETRCWSEKPDGEDGHCW